jgi:hypothetical protein
MCVGLAKSLMRLQCGGVREDACDIYSCQEEKSIHGHAYGDEGMTKLPLDRSYRQFWVTVRLGCSFLSFPDLFQTVNFLCRMQQ